jgi:hypothetical protein
MVCVDNHICTCIKRTFVYLDNLPVEYNRILQNDQEYMNTLVVDTDNDLLRYILRFIPYMDAGLYVIQVDLEHNRFVNNLSGIHVTGEEKDFGNLFSFHNNLETLFSLTSYEE